MTYTCCMTSNRALAKDCARHEDDAGKHLLAGRPDGTPTCPFFMPKASQSLAMIEHLN